MRLINGKDALHVCRKLSYYRGNQFFWWNHLACQKWDPALISNTPVTHVRSRHIRQVPRVRQMQVPAEEQKTSAQSGRKSNTSSLGTSTIYTNSPRGTPYLSSCIFLRLFSADNAQSTSAHTTIYLKRNRKGAACQGGGQDWMVCGWRGGQRAGVWRSSMMSRFGPNRGK